MASSSGMANHVEIVKVQRVSDSSYVRRAIGDLAIRLPIRTAVSRSRNAEVPETQELSLPEIALIDVAGSRGTREEDDDFSVLRPSQPSK
jgi:hypothetical protein